MGRRVALLALAALTVAACGGGGDLSATERRAAAGELQSYLRTVRAEQRMFVRVQHASISANDAVNTTKPDISWAAAAKTLAESREAYETLALRLRDIRPPDALEEGHDALARSVNLFARYVDGYQRALRTKRGTALLEWADRSEVTGARMIELRRSWRRELEAYAAELEVRLPRWVDAVGKPLA